MVGVHKASGKLDTGPLACPTESVKKNGLGRMSQL